MSKFMEEHNKAVKKASQFYNCLNDLNEQEYRQKLRIEFAKAALAGMLQSVAYIEADIFAKTIAKRAFDIADAMVERLNK